MPVTITRLFDATAKDPYEIQITRDDFEKIILHARDRPGSDRILIVLMENLLDVETKP